MVRGPEFGNTVLVNSNRKENNGNLDNAILTRDNIFFMAMQ
jgi:hypothetical protein